MSSIEQDVTALAAGQPDISNLQRLTALSKQHQITLPGQPEEDNIAKERLIWVNDRLFDRILQSLVTFLDPAQVRPFGLTSS